MKCHKCGKEITHVDCLDEDKEPICMYCASKMVKCRCGFYTDNMYMCKNCAEKSFDNLINPYSTRVTHMYKNKDGTNKCLNKRYYGFEIEYNNIQPALLYYNNKAMYRDKLIYNKHDTSVDNGVEINIVPSDYSSIKQIINRLNLALLLKYNTINEIYNNAGVHIHVSKNSVPKEDIYKLNLLFNYNINSKYKKYIYYLTNRIDKLFKNYNDSYYRIGSVNYKKMLGCDHYTAINFSNEHTIEFRLFGSTIHKKRLLGYIEFVNLALDFVNKNPIKKMSVKNFLLYMKENAENPCNRYRIRAIEKSGLTIDKEHEVNFSYKKLFEIFKLMDGTSIEDRIRFLSQIPLSDIDDNITLDNYKSYMNASDNNGFKKALRNKLIELISRKETTTCV